MCCIVSVPHVFWPLDQNQRGLKVRTYIPHAKLVSPNSDVSPTFSLGMFYESGTRPLHMCVQVLTDFA